MKNLPSEAKVFSVNKGYLTEKGLDGAMWDSISGDAKVFVRLIGCGEESCPDVTEAGMGLAGFVIRVIAGSEVASALKSAAEVTQNDDGVVDSAGVMGFAIIAGVDDDGVVEHGAIAFGHRFECGGKAGNFFKMEATNFLAFLENLSSLAMADCSMESANSKLGIGAGS